VAWRLLSTLSRAFNTTPITGTATFSNANTTAVTSTAVTTLVANQSLVGKKAFGMKIAAVSGLGNYGIIGISRATGTSAGIGFDGSNSYGAYSNGSNFPSGGNSMTWTLGTDLAAVVDQGASLILVHERWNELLWYSYGKCCGGGGGHEWDRHFGNDSSDDLSLCWQLF
jgi:hypothetical protein